MDEIILPLSYDGVGFSFILEPMNALTSTISNTINTHELFAASNQLVVMVSGGGDSVALLRLLVEAGYKDVLTVLHVNHLLRGAEADQDEMFVQELCAELGVGCEVRRFDVRVWAAEQGGLNLEDAGRTLRYRAADELLDCLCGEHGLPREDGRVVTAHTRDDRVETFFIRTIFGSGLGALAGMARQRGRLVRPLLDVDRSILRAWLEASGYTWREDSSNTDLQRTRAFVRSRIVPAAEELRANFRENLSRTMDLVADDDRLLTTMARQFARDFAHMRKKGERVELDLRLLATLERVMLRRVIRTAIVETFPEASRLEAFHIEAIADAVGEFCRHDKGTNADSGLRSEVDASPPFTYSRDIPPALRVSLKCATLVVSRIPALNAKGSEV